MRVPACLLALPLACACTTSAPRDPDMRVALVLAGGEGELGSGGVQTYDTPWIGHVAAEVRRESWQVGLETGMQFSQANGSDSGQARDLEIGEFWLGAGRAVPVAPFLLLDLGAGLRTAEAHLYGPGFIFGDELDSDWSMGVYAHAGAYLRLGRHLGIGADLRWADGSDFDLAGRGRDAQLVQLLLALRWEI